MCACMSEEVRVRTCVFVWVGAFVCVCVCVGRQVGARARDRTNPA